MKEPKARLLLRLIPLVELTAAEVQAAFRERVKLTHPDTATELSGSISDLKEARATLLHIIEKQNNTCAACRGTGKVRTSAAGFTQCPACRGKGEK